MVFLHTWLIYDNKECMKNISHWFKDYFFKNNVFDLSPGLTIFSASIFYFKICCFKYFSKSLISLVPYFSILPLIKSALNVVFVSSDQQRGAVSYSREDNKSGSDSTSFLMPRN